MTFNAGNNKRLKLANPATGRSAGVAGLAKPGFSLLELILALALTVVVGGMIITGIRVYMVQLNRQQSNIERQTVARSSLNMVASDLRAALQYKANDYSGLYELFESQALAAGTVTAEEIEEEEEEDGDLVADEEVVDFRPSFIGSANAIRLDVSRLPRLDQYNPLITSVNQEDRTPSDIRSISYFFSDQPGRSQEQVDFSPTDVTGGLYRRSIDRAVANFAGEDSIVDFPDERSELVAAEVSEIGFRYFDGEGWVDNWDSEESGGFPSAVEISIVINPFRSQGSSSQGSDTRTESQAGEFHRLVVHLPMAELPPEEEDSP